MRTFGQVPLKLWRDKKFRALSDDAKLATLIMWCGPHSASAGVFELQDGYAALDLGWTLERWQAARKDAEAKGIIKRNAETEEILIWNFFEANRPKNAGTIAAIRSQIDTVACEDLKREALDAFTATLPAPKPQAEIPSRLGATNYMQRR